MAYILDKKVVKDTKAFNDFFSQSIEMEYNHKIDTISLKPFKV